MESWVRAYIWLLRGFDTHEIRNERLISFYLTGYLNKMRRDGSIRIRFNLKDPRGYLNGLGGF